MFHISFKNLIPLKKQPCYGQLVGIGLSAKLYGSSYSLPQGLLVLALIKQLLGKFQVDALYW